LLSPYQNRCRQASACRVRSGDSALSRFITSADKDNHYSTSIWRESSASILCLFPVPLRIAIPRRLQTIRHRELWLWLVAVLCSRWNMPKTETQPNSNPLTADLVEHSGPSFSSKDSSNKELLSKTDLTLLAKLAVVICSVTMAMSCNENVVIGSMPRQRARHWQCSGILGSESCTSFIKLPSSLSVFRPSLSPSCRPTVASQKSLLRLPRPGDSPGRVMVATLTPRAQPAALRMRVR